MENLIDVLKEEMKRQFKDVGGDHGYDHTINVYNCAVHLARVENADIKVIEAAALLHDIGRKEEMDFKGRIDHALIGAEKARKILMDLGLDQEFIVKVYFCVLRHRSRNNWNPETLEEKIIFDADKLDSIGATGIGRAFMWAGKVGARLHTKNPDLSVGAEYSHEDTAYREFVIKLDKIKDKIYTNEGKRLAVRRHEFMVKFFDELNHEMEGDI